MTLADTNIWLALALSDHRYHVAAAAWMESKPSVAFCRATQTSFLRLVTTGAVLNAYGSRPLTNEEAWLLYDRFLADTRISYLQEPAGLDAHWKKLAVRKIASPKLWMDAYLAAFAMAGGYQLITTDAGFHQFDGLDVVTLSAV